VDCKKLLAENINQNLAPLREKRNELAKDPDDVRDVLIDGARRAGEIAEATMEGVRKAVALP